uniref:Putative toxin-antitoxin system toxin component, PIN family n=1 Tax=Candidatus Kentrum sp. LPFa TaxID=2126335 RepID=A0A450XLK7_9GAMM|nr:MAG: putative toxin-antitoxin system toxin component, PIN family [Candidatus Kentron sp. LPFa]VFK30157.1 MAG: putative toxin-antitoxin system toxin component, PIN family [Candidatus Kentron sp. LPFa]
MSNTIVFDTNVLISASLAETSIPYDAFAHASENNILIFSLETYQEFEEKISLSKFDKWVDKEKRAKFLYLVLSLSSFVEITGKRQGCRDMKDDKFLETARVGCAKYLVSGDKDLLEIRDFHGIAIVSPREYMARSHLHGNIHEDRS